MQLQNYHAVIQNFLNVKKDLFNFNLSVYENSKLGLGSFYGSHLNGLKLDTAFSHKHLFHYPCQVEAAIMTSESAAFVNG